MNATACDLPDDLLEKYAMNALSESESEPLEEHLILCPVCQQHLSRLDDFIQIMKAALVESVTAGHPTQERKPMMMSQVAR